MENNFDKERIINYCTESFTKEWIGKIKKCRLWIKEML